MLQAAWQSIDITPPLGGQLDGYEQRDDAGLVGAFVHDPLMARVTVLRDESIVVVCISIDWCRVSVARTQAWETRLIAALAEQLGIAVDAVVPLVSYTHTHSGPVVEDWQVFDGSGGAGTLPGAAGAYVEETLEKIVSLCCAVAQTVAPVALRAWHGRCDAGYNRRVPTTGDTVAMCWNRDEQADVWPEPLADPTVSALELRAVVADPITGDEQSSASRRLLWSAPFHPVTLGKTSDALSADWPGAVAAALAADGIDAAFAMAAAGDGHPQYATGGDVADLAAQAAPVTALLRQALDRVAAPVPLTLTGARGLLAVGHEMVPVAAAPIGDQLLIATPVELFNFLGQDLRNRLLSAHDPINGVHIYTNSCGWNGYWPDRASFAGGNYEIIQARGWGREPGCGETLIDQLIDWVQSRIFTQP
jgi:hypothetical protein